MVMQPEAALRNIFMQVACVQYVTNKQNLPGRIGWPFMTRMGKYA
jgi:hypothetical protein